MDMYNKLKYIAEYKNSEKIKNVIRDKFEQVLIKCLQTTFVGTLSIFEDEFGYLWGQDQETLTKEQKEFKNKWKRVRTKIFDLGNNQINFTKKQLNIFYKKSDNNEGKKNG